MSSCLVVAADVVLRSGLQALLGGVTDLEVAVSGGYDLVVGPDDVDVALVHLDGSPEAVSLVTRLAVRLAVMVVGRDDEGDDVLGRLADGASAYLLQDDLDAAELQRAWSAVRRGGVHTSPGATAVLRTQVRALSSGSPVDHLLSEREQEVMALVAWGLTDQRIGEVAGITAKTVQNHLQNIYTRHDLHSRAAAVAWWRSRPWQPSGWAPRRDIDL